MTGCPSVAGLGGDRGRPPVFFVLDGIVPEGDCRPVEDSLLLDVETCPLRKNVLALSRRIFLKVSGATLLAAALPFDLPAPALGADEVVGRALRSAPVYPRRDGRAPVIQHLWPDEVVPILGCSSGWYAVPGGFVRQTDVQLMLPYDPGKVVPAAALPAWLVVSAPVAPVRAWASGAAPLVTRVGYGGVLCAVDCLQDGRGALWYAVAATTDGEPLGWTPALRWSAVRVAGPPAVGGRRMRLDPTRAQLSAWEGQRRVLRAPTVVPQNVRHGAFRLTGRQPALPDSVAGHYGAAWVLRGAEFALYGAHWHNAFGEPGPAPGWEVSPWVARWLFGWLPDGAEVEIG